MSHTIRKGLRHIRVSRESEADTGQTAPSQRTLDALADAVRRAREATDVAAAGDRVRAVPPYARRPAPSAGAAGAFWRVDPLRTRRRGLRRAAALGTLGVVLLAVILTLSLGGGTRSPRPPAAAGSRPGTQARASTPRASATTTPVTVPPATSPRPAPTQTTTTVAPATTTTTTSVPSGASRSPAPQLSSITPSQSRPGTVVVVHGTDLFSPNGVVLARFDGQPTHTICLTQTSCRVTVPPLPGSPSSVRVTITTESGTSNALYFVYG
jgi:hypothetical protein